MRCRLDTRLVRVSMRPCSPSTVVWQASLAPRGIVEEGADIVVQAALVALQSKHVVAALFGDLRSNCPLAVQRIRGHDAAFQRQHLQKLRHCRDLVGLVIDRDLAEQEPLIGGPGMHHVQWRLAGRPVERAPQVLPSIATTPSRAAAKRSMNRTKQARNGAGSRRRNTRLNVSWLGMPCRRRRNCRRNGSLPRRTAPCPNSPRRRTAWCTVR